MTYTAHESNIRTIRQEDPDFYIHDGIIVAARASIEFSADCPKHVAHSIQQYVMNGWIKSVANVKDNELMWEVLSQ